MRIGWGYDIHPLVEGRDLMLGGVKVPFQKGLSGHSDADVLIHAICDAILGALGRGDLGRHFPDDDPRFEGVASIYFLREVVRQAHEQGYGIRNLDTTVITQTPRLVNFLAQMEAELAGALQIETTRVNVKATSPEGIGPIGHGDAIAAQCVVLLEERQDK
jgi:2-C-methyl-D-erythritol 2,4-cyclodiphosphate synthase